jgi:aryl-alcohol dehydrogenase-like predicted oxidoreductase
MFGGIYYKPADNTHDLNLMHEQLGALTTLVKAGKVRAIGLSNESAFGLHAFMQLAQQHNLSPIASVQNPYSLVNRSIENGLDETMHQLDVALLAYSPLAFGILTGKYDATGLYGEHAPQDARMVKYDSVKKQRWARPDALASAKLYNNLASKYGLTPTQLALAFCYHKWQVASTIIGVTSLAQLDECVQAYNITLSKECLTEIDALRWLHRDYAQ